MKTIILFAAFFASRFVLADSIWEPSKTCKTKQFGVWYSCPNLPDVQSIEFAPNKISTSDSEFIKSLPILNQVGYSTYCKSSKPLDFGLIFNNRVIALGWNTADTIQNSFSYDEQNKNYSLKLAVPTSSTGVLDPCHVEILTNSSKVSDKPIRVYANSIIKSVTRLNRISRDLADLETLSSGWSNLESVSEDLDLEIILLQTDLETYPKDSTEYTAANERKKFYEDIKNYIADALGVAEACQSENLDSETKALCLTKAKTLGTVVKGYRDESVTELKAIKSFVDSEKSRLETLDATYAQQFGQIGDSISKVTK